MMYMTTRDNYMYNVYDLGSGLHIRQGHGGFYVIIKERKRAESNFVNSDDYTKMGSEDENRFLGWLFDTIFNGIEKIIFEKDL